MNAIKLLHNGQVVTGSEDKTIRIWELNHNYKESVCTLEGHDKVYYGRLRYYKHDK